MRALLLRFGLYGLTALTICASSRAADPGPVVAGTTDPVHFSGPVHSSTGVYPAKLEAFAQCDGGHPRIMGKVEAGVYHVDLPARTRCTLLIGEWDWDAQPLLITDAATAVALAVLVYPRQIPEQALARELIEMANHDLALRDELRRSTDAKFIDRAHPEDSARQQRLAEIITAKGWPMRSMVGWQAADAAWLIAQHSPQKRLKPWLSLMRKAALTHEIRPSNLATTIDRVLMYDNNKQLYGTQSLIVNGVNTLHPVADSAQLPQRRRSMGF